VGTVEILEFEEMDAMRRTILVRVVLAVLVLGGMKVSADDQ